jgi:predicted MFS family arabinose efflux permease
MVASSIAGNELVGPVVGAWLFALGVALPVAMDGGLLAAAALFILTLPAITTPAPPETGATLRSQVMSGVKWLARHSTLRPITIAGGILMLLDTAWYAILVLFVLEELRLSQTGFGLLLALAAVGGLAGSAAAGRLQPGSPSTLRYVGSLVVAGVTQLIVGVAEGVVVVGAMLALSSAAFAVWNVSAAALRQRHTPRDHLGRVSAAYNTVLVGAGAIGAALGGGIASGMGLRAPMLLGGPILIISGFWLRRALQQARSER